MTRWVRIFLSSPGDVEEERQACERVVQELNLTLRTLLPERDLQLELVGWQTHTHPDVGRGPQDVIDAQLDNEYDIFLGIMWTRFGTPTGSAGSGTEHEFRAARKGWEERRRPRHIMFYFGEAPVPRTELPRLADQALKVDQFRAELSRLGLIGVYEDSAQFADQIRKALVNAVGQLLRDDGTLPPGAARTAPRASTTELAIVLQQVMKAADDYERIRADMPHGDARTRRMEVVASRLRTLGPSARPLLPELMAENATPGRHLAAVCVLQSVPSPDYLDWLVDRIPSESPFIGYHALVALTVAIRELPCDHLNRLAAAVGRAERVTAAAGSVTDRRRTVQLARQELERRQRECGNPEQTRG